MRVVGKALIDSYPNKIMNIHPALLPSFPGLHGQRQAVDYGVKISGCTVHFVDEGVDMKVLIRVPSLYRPLSRPIMMILKILFHRESLSRNTGFSLLRSNYFLKGK
jgi:hypothetical protein